jgi:hypothetical protein
MSAERCRALGDSPLPEGSGIRVATGKVRGAGVLSLAGGHQTLLYAGTVALRRRQSVIVGIGPLASAAVTRLRWPSALTALGSVTPGLRMMRVTMP